MKACILLIVYLTTLSFTGKNVTQPAGEKTGLDSIILKWDQLTLQSIQLQANNNKNKDQKKMYKDRLRFELSSSKDSVVKENSLRTKFLKTFPEILQNNRYVIIEETSAGDKISYYNTVVSFRNNDSIIIAFYEYTFEGWIKKRSTTGKYFYIDPGIEKYRDPSGFNFNEAVITYFINDAPISSGYFIPGTLTPSIFEAFIH